MQLFGSYILGSHKSTIDPQIEEYIQIGKKKRKKKILPLRELNPGLLCERQLS